jgi:FixJ family two-component response regulator
LLKSLDHTVAAFGSAAEFLASPKLLVTACLVADVHMPAMTGIELYQLLVGMNFSIPTILVTAYPSDIDRRQMLAVGVNGYLEKPIDEGDLIGCLERALPAKP